MYISKDSSKVKSVKWENEAHKIQYGRRKNHNHHDLTLYTLSFTPHKSYSHHSLYLPPPSPSSRRRPLLSDAFLPHSPPPPFSIPSPKNPPHRHSPPFSSPPSSTPPQPPQSRLICRQDEAPGPRRSGTSPLSLWYTSARSRYSRNFRW